MICTFFGHRDAPGNIEPMLNNEILKLINKGVNMFYVGNNGKFDRIVQKLLYDFSLEYIIDFRIVLAYIPKNDGSINREYLNRTVMPDGFEKVPRRFAIDYRNRWMINCSDYVVTYIIDRIGSDSAKYATIAKNKGKNVINLV